MSEATLVSIVVPVFNEESNLEELVRRTVETADGLGRPYEFLLVDDGSHDRSADLIREAARRHPGRVRGILLNRNYGQHAAVMAGFSETRGEIVVTLDADLQNPPEEIPKLVAKMDEGYDVVGSIREKRKDSAFRRLSSWTINRVIQKSTGVLMHDYGCMLRAYRRFVVKALLSCTERSLFIPVLANSFARRTTEVEVAHSERAAGSSKYSIMKLVHLQFDLMTGMTTFPLRVLSLFGLLLSSLGVAFGVFLLIMRLVHGPAWAAQGVFTLFALLFVFIGGQFIALGLLGEYIGRIYKDVRARPQYIVETIVEESQLERKPLESEIARSG